MNTLFKVIEYLPLIVTIAEALKDKKLSRDEFDKIIEEALKDKQINIRVSSDEFITDLDEFIEEIKKASNDGVIKNEELKKILLSAYDTVD